MNDNDAKEGALNALYDEFIKIQWVLDKAGVKAKCIQTLKSLCKDLENLHINKIKTAQTWLAKFIHEYITPWKKIRAENTEVVWANYEMMGYGNEFPEIKELNARSKAVRLNWEDRHNLLFKQKKEEKKE